MGLFDRFKKDKKTDDKLKKYKKANRKVNYQETKEAISQKVKQSKEEKKAEKRKQKAEWLIIKKEISVLKKDIKEIKQKFKLDKKDLSKRKKNLGETYNQMFYEMKDNAYHEIEEKKEKIYNLKFNYGKKHTTIIWVLKKWMFGVGKEFRRIIWSPPLVTIKYLGIVILIVCLLTAIFTGILEITKFI